MYYVKTRLYQEIHKQRKDTNQKRGMCSIGKGIILSVYKDSYKATKKRSATPRAIITPTVGQRFEQAIHKSRSAHEASQMILNVISNPVNAN